MSDLNVKQSINDLATGITNATKARFGQSGLPSQFGTKKKIQTKVTTNVKKEQAVETAGRKLIRLFYSTKAPQLEALINSAMNQVIASLTENSSGGITVGPRSVGNAKPRTPLNNYPPFRFIKSRQGQPEIGLPDPNQSMEMLRVALYKSIIVRVTVTAFGPRIRLEFNLDKLLLLTPHPNRNSEFYSWLSLVTGPKFLSKGIATHGYVARSSVRSRSLVKIFRSSRTQRGLMISRDSSLFTKLRLNTYVPNNRYDGFWNKWWNQEIKPLISLWFRRVVMAAHRQILGGVI